MNEIIFLVEEALEGGFTAKTLGESIFTEGEAIDELKTNIREAVDCHFAQENKPKLIQLYMVKEEVITV